MKQRLGDAVTARNFEEKRYAKAAGVPETGALIGCARVQSDSRNAKLSVAWATDRPATRCPGTGQLMAGILFLEFIAFADIPALASGQDLPDRPTFGHFDRKKWKREKQSPFPLSHTADYCGADSYLSRCD